MKNLEEKWKRIISIVIAFAIIVTLIPNYTKADTTGKSITVNVELYDIETRNLIEDTNVNVTGTLTVNGRNEKVEFSGTNTTGVFSADISLDTWETLESMEIDSKTYGYSTVDLNNHEVNYDQTITIKVKLGNYLNETDSYEEKNDGETRYTPEDNATFKFQDYFKITNVIKEDDDILYEGTLEYSADKKASVLETGELDLSHCEKASFDEGIDVSATITPVPETEEEGYRYATQKYTHKFKFNQINTGIKYNTNKQMINFGQKLNNPRYTSKQFIVDNGYKFSYESSNEEVATVGNNGEVTSTNIGSTKITASLDLSNIYAPTSASYDLEVKEYEVDDFEPKVDESKNTPVKDAKGIEWYNSNSLTFIDEDEAKEGTDTVIDKYGIYGNTTALNKNTFSSLYDKDWDTSCKVKLNEGENTIYFYARNLDKSDKTNKDSITTTPKTLDVYVDTTPPEVTKITDKSWKKDQNFIYANDVTFNYEVKDSYSGVSEVYYAVETDTKSIDYNKCNWQKPLIDGTVDIRFSTHQKYNVFLKVVDVAGNITYYNVIEGIYDNSAPEVTEVSLQDKVLDADTLTLLNQNKYSLQAKCTDSVPSSEIGDLDISFYKYNTETKSYEDKPSIQFSNAKIDSLEETEDELITTVTYDDYVEQLEDNTRYQVRAIATDKAGNKSEEKVFGDVFVFTGTASINVSVWPTLINDKYITQGNPQLTYSISRCPSEMYNSGYVQDIILENVYYNGTALSELDNTDNAYYKFESTTTTGIDQVEKLSLVKDGEYKVESFNFTNEAGTSSGDSNKFEFIVDRATPEIDNVATKIETKSNDNGYYNAEDIDINVRVSKKLYYAKYKTLSYEVYDGDNLVEALSGTLDVTDSSKLSTDDNGYTIIENTFTIKGEDLKANSINSDNIRVVVKVEDEAGRTDSLELTPIKISTDIPRVTVKYKTGDNPIVNGEFYQGTANATIQITSKLPDTFDTESASNAVIVTAKNKSGEVSFTKYTAWETTKDTDNDEYVHTMELQMTDSATYSISINQAGNVYTDKADNKAEFSDASDSGVISFTIDNDKPENVKVSTEIQGNVIKEFFDFVENNNADVRFPIITNNKSYVVNILGDGNGNVDKTSAVDVFYYRYSINDKSKKNLTAADLDKLEDSKWVSDSNLYIKDAADTKDGIPENGTGITISDKGYYQYYFKVIDRAGNYIYINSQGNIIDETAPVISDITCLEASGSSENANKYFNEDVKVNFNVQEKEDNYSGISKITYSVYNFKTKGIFDACNKESDFNKKYPTEYRTQYEEDIINDDENGPTYSDITDTKKKDIGFTVNSKDNNSDYVVIVVTATDRAGNQSVQSKLIKIDVTKPTISIQFDNNDIKKQINNRGYYSANRTATITIVERESSFDKNKVEVAKYFSAVDGQGKELTDINIKNMMSSWSTSKTDDDDPNNDTHTATVTFSKDANYKFNITVVDNADNANDGVAYPNHTDGTTQKTPNEFTVDKVAASGTLDINAIDRYSSLITDIRFAIWKNFATTYKIGATDVTSPIDGIYYYITEGTTALTVRELNNIKSWTTYSGNNVPIGPNSQATIYVKLVDYAKNVSYLSSNGMIFDSQVPAISITPEENSIGIYNGAVNVDISVVDPTAGNTYSGIKNITYSVLNMGTETQSGTLYSYTNENPTKEQLLQKWTGSITIDPNLNNSNDVKILVNATDNAGNTYTATSTVMIDISKPVINVSYDNNNGDTSFTGMTLYREDRTATITIEERNFDPSKVDINITNTDGTIPTVSGWTTKDGTGNGDDTVHTGTITYSADGDYTFDISCKDMVDNQSDESVNYGSSQAPTSFTIDKTQPTISVVYDNNNSVNGMYFNSERTATITVNEHNFDASRITYTSTATEDGNAKTAPALSSWTTSGDVHTATISFADDADYAWDISYTDKAGNEANTIEHQTFCVDKTKPEVIINGVVNQSANAQDGNIGFTIQCTDTNFDIFTPKLEVVDMSNGSYEVKEIEMTNVSDIHNGKIYKVDNLESDGVYSVTCIAVDKAGNTYDTLKAPDKDGNLQDVDVNAGDTLTTFSVNRMGSTFLLGDYAEDRVEKGYVQDIEDSIDVIEINPDPVEAHDITINNTSIDDGDVNISKEHEDGTWYKYTYSMDKQLFAEEGDYSVIVKSTDKAGTDAYSDVKGAKIDFTVDRTAPIVNISGVKNGGRYQKQTEEVTVIATDDGSGIGKIEAIVLEADGSPIKNSKGKDISVRFSMEGEILTEYLEKNDGKIKFTIPEGYQNQVKIVASDNAVNDSNETNEYIKTFTKVTVSANFWIIFYANKPLFYGSILGGIALIIGIILLIVFGKRKKQ